MQKQYSSTSFEVKKSPFIVGRAIRSDELLIGRDHIISQLETQFASFSNANVVGNRRMGKTSLLNHLIARAPRYLILQEGVPSVLARVDFHSVSDAEHFFGTAVRELLAAIPPTYTLGTYLSAIQKQIIENPTADFGVFERVLYALRDRSSIYVRPVILVDEFEVVLDPTKKSTFPFPNFFNQLSSLISANVLSMIIFSRRPLADYFSDPNLPESLTSTFPRYFPTFHLELLTEADADALLLQPSDHTLSLSQAKTAKSWAGGHPCHLQAAGAAWYETLMNSSVSKKAAYKRYKQLIRNGCMEDYSRKSVRTVAPQVYSPLRRVMSFVFQFLISVGRIAKFIGMATSDTISLITGIIIVVLILSIILGIIHWTELLPMIRKVLGA